MSLSHKHLSIHKKQCECCTSTITPATRPLTRRSNPLSRVLGLFKSSKFELGRHYDISASDSSLSVADSDMTLTVEAEMMDEENMAWGKPTSTRPRKNTKSTRGAGRGFAQMMDEGNMSWGQPRSSLPQTVSLPQPRDVNASVTDWAQDMDEQNVAWGRPAPLRVRIQQ